MLPQAQEQGGLADEKNKKAQQKRPKMLDVLEAKALSEEARKRNVELDSLIRQTGPVVIQSELRESVSKKVGALTAPNYQHSDVLDEVTEKLVDAANYDDGIKRWFG